MLGAGDSARTGWLFFESSSRSIFLFEHDLFGKPVSTFPDHALSQSFLDIQCHRSARLLAAGLRRGFQTASGRFDFSVRAKAKSCGLWHFSDMLGELTMSRADMVCV